MSDQTNKPTIDYQALNGTPEEQKRRFEKDQKENELFRDLSFPQQLEVKQQQPLNYDDLEALIARHDHKISVDLRRCFEALVKGEKDFRLEAIKPLGDGKNNDNVRDHSILNNPDHAYKPETSVRDEPLTLGAVEGILLEHRKRLFSNLNRFFEEALNREFKEVSKY